MIVCKIVHRTSKHFAQLNVQWAHPVGGRVWLWTNKHFLTGEFCPLLRFYLFTQFDLFKPNQVEKLCNISKWLDLGQGDDSGNCWLHLWIAVNEGHSSDDGTVVRSTRMVTLIDNLPFSWIMARIGIAIDSGTHCRLPWIPLQLCFRCLLGWLPLSARFLCKQRPGIHSTSEQLTKLSFS